MKNKISNKIKSIFRPVPRFISSLSPNKKRLAIFLGPFVIIGVILLISAQAATIAAYLEAENGTPSSGAVIVNNDNSAAGRGHIRFGSTTPNNPGCADGPIFTSNNICINPASIPAPRQVTSRAATRQVPDSRIMITDANDNLVPAVRIHCEFSHVSRNDPIVFPGQKDPTHWHIFSGNTRMDETTTNSESAPASTCPGGTINRTGYWAPLLIDTNSYNPTTKQFNMAQPMSFGDTQNPGAPGRGGAFMQAYYKTGYNGVVSRDVNWFPKGLRMIAGGDPMVAPTGRVVTQTPYGADNRMVTFDCISWGDAGSKWGTEGVDWGIGTIPTRCPPNYYVQANITFPQCGAVDANGNPVLDSPDHRSHMSYPRGTHHPWPVGSGPITPLGCPASHPRAYPEILEHFRWRVPAGGASGLRFSSDRFAGAQPGWTFHADWWNGWDEATGQAIINSCYRGGSNQRGYDCGNDLVGNGTQLLLDP